MFFSSCDITSAKFAVGKAVFITNFTLIKPVELTKEKSHSNIIIDTGESYLIFNLYGVRKYQITINSVGYQD